jgi:hypothetical protein
MWHNFVFSLFFVCSVSVTVFLTGNSDTIFHSYYDPHYILHLSDLLTTCHHKKSSSSEECHRAEYIHRVRNEMNQIKTQKLVRQGDSELEIVENIPFSTLFENYISRGRSIDRLRIPLLSLTPR